MSRSEGMGWGTWLLIVIAIVIVVAVVALSIYGGTVSPQQHQVEQVIPNDRFPH